MFVHLLCLPSYFSRAKHGYQQAEKATCGHLTQTYLSYCRRRRYTLGSVAILGFAALPMFFQAIPDVLVNASVDEGEVVIEEIVADVSESDTQEQEVVDPGLPQSLDDDGSLGETAEVGTDSGEVPALEEVPLTYEEVAAFLYATYEQLDRLAERLTQKKYPIAEATPFTLYAESLAIEAEVLLRQGNLIGAEEMIAQTDALLVEMNAMLSQPRDAFVSEESMMEDVEENIGEATASAFQEQANAKGYLGRFGSEFAGMAAGLSFDERQQIASERAMARHYIGPRTGSAC